MSSRPSLYRTMRVVMSDGSTIRLPAAVRTVGNTLALERDPANHPVYLVRTPPPCDTCCVRTVASHADPASPFPSLVFPG